MNQHIFYVMDNWLEAHSSHDLGKKANREISCVSKEIVLPLLPIISRLFKPQFCELSTYYGFLYYPKWKNPSSVQGLDADFFKFW